MTWLFNRAFGQLRESAKRTLRNDWFIIVALFVTTIVVRGISHLSHPQPTGCFIYHGSPISDGVSYTYKAINIAQGNGIPSGAQPAIRPFYAIVLACVYTWTGFSLAAVTWLNIVVGGATAALIYLCGKVALNRFCGFAAALFFAVDPTQLVQIPQACTEPLGLFFFVGSVYLAIKAFEKQGSTWFFLAGLFIGLCNLTRTLTLFTLPFYGVAVLFVGWRKRCLRAAAVRALMLLLGFACVTAPWIIRQKRSFGITTISDNIGEALYCATSPVYKRWTSVAHKDAEAAGIPNTVRDRYRFFNAQAIENVRRNPGFYLGNVAGALWEYANTFGPRSRSLDLYGNDYSGVIESQRLLLVVVLILIFGAWLVRSENPLALSNLLFLVTSVGLTFLYRALPEWLTFLPVLAGAILSWRFARPIPVVLLFGSLAMTVVGSAIFANAILFRTIVMTDWLFVLFFLAAIWFPAELVSRRFARTRLQIDDDVTGHESGAVPFQNALSLYCRRAVCLGSAVLLAFFAVTGIQLLISTLSHRVVTINDLWGPAWVPPSKSHAWELSRQQQVAILARLGAPPFGVVSQPAETLPLYNGNRRGPAIGEYVVQAHAFSFSYRIPQNEAPWTWAVAPEPYPRTLVSLRQYEFVIPGEVPPDFALRPLVFVGVVVPQEKGAKKQTTRIHVKGLAVIPLRNGKWPDYAHAFCAPF